MAKLKPIREKGLPDGKIIGYIFKCPGCHQEHHVNTNVPPNYHWAHGYNWGFNGNVDAPTFTPSILIKTGHYVDGKHPCWCDYNKEHPDDPGPKCSVCHSFVRDGKIQFLNDCTHELAGQTIELEDYS